MGFTCPYQKEFSDEAVLLREPRSGEGPRKRLGIAENGMEGMEGWRKKSVE